MNWETDWLEGRCRINPEDIAVVEPEKGQKWTYREMNNRAVRIANLLKQKGIQKGDRVALISPNDASYLDLFFACGKLGVIFVPLNWRLSSVELNYILNDCRPALLACHTDMKKLAEHLEAPVKMEIGTEEYENYANSKGSEPVFPANHADDEAAIIYTGGTTGMPKGAVLTHKAIYWNAMNTILSWNLSSEDVTLTYLPMFHTGGLNALTIPIMIAGGKTVIGSKFNPEDAIRLLNRERCTIVLLVPTMHHLLINSPDFKDTRFPSMKTFLSGGAPCPHSIYKAYYDKGIAFKEGYGLTEAGPNNFYIHPAEAAQKHGSVGRAMMMNNVKIVDEMGNEAEAGRAGELLIQGHHVFKKYWNNAEATSSALKNGWLHTGDLAKKDEDGCHYILGRKKEMIISGGENIFPLEIEHQINQHPAVSEVSVVGLPDEKWGEIVSAFIVIKNGKTLTAQEIKDHCGQKLGRYKIPKHVVFLDELPKTDVGKIDKKAIKAQHLLSS